MKKQIIPFYIIAIVILSLVVSACSGGQEQTAESPPVQTEVPLADTIAPPTNTPIPPTPDLTADWPEYINTDLGYSFKYPADCFLGPLGADCKQNPPEQRPPECLCFLNAEDPYAVMMQSFVGDPAEGLMLVTFSVASRDTPAYHPPEEGDWVPWLQETWSYLSDEMPGETNQTIGGFPAVQIYTPGGGGGASAENIFVVKNGKLIQISMVNVDTEAQLEFYQLVLSTFQFTE